MKPLKEAYFTPATIAPKSMAMKRSLIDRFHKQPVAFTPNRSALLVLDMQAYFLETLSHAFIPSAPAIAPRVNELIEAFSVSNLPIFFTRHINTPEDAGTMATWWHEIITHDHPLGQIDPSIETRNGVRFTKTRYDAFIDSPLEGMLLEKHVHQVVITGVMTHLCCETTARSAFMRGFNVFFMIDGTATYNEAFHRASILNLAHGFATLALVDDILREMEISGYG
jgi:isochorismate hydrolase